MTLATTADTSASAIPAPRDRWWLWTLLIWLAIAAGVIWWRWGRIHWFALGDTDDNMRMMQVRALLDGQGWYDLRQYRLSPPGGFNMHWSRLVDLPIAGIVLGVKPFFGSMIAEKTAIAVAPLLPLGVTLLALGAAVRRLVGSWAWLLPPVVMLTAGSALGMFSPARIDHHGWQLACLALLVFGLADPAARRGGIVAGLATALSLVIGFEMMPYLALAGIAVTLRWIWDGDEAPRLFGYGGALAVGTGIGFALFHSRDNLTPLCDALTPPWLLATMLGGALLMILARLKPSTRAARLGSAAAAGVALAAAFALNSPQCLGRPEGVSPALQADWLDNIREARPVTVQDWRTIVSLLALPVMGLVGALLALWRARRTPAMLAAWGALTLLAACALALLFFQVRAAAASQLLAIPGVTALVWIITPKLHSSRSMMVRVLGVTVLFLAATGLGVQAILGLIPKAPDRPPQLAVRRAGASCATILSMAPLQRIPKATFLTMVDLGPRLITLTHHNALAGPYHRNGMQILDVHRVFKGSEADARQVAAKYGATYLMICPKFPETTVYRAKSPKGFYARLEDGQVPAWLEPVALPKGSPLRLWRITRTTP